MSEKNVTDPEYWTTTECPKPKDTNEQQFHFIFLKFLLPFIFIVACISILIYCAMKKRRLDELRHRLVPFYKFEPGDCEDEWQTEFLEDGNGRKSLTRLQDYRSTGSEMSENKDEKSYL